MPSSSPFAFSLPQHQDLFSWVGSSHQVAQSIGTSASTSVLLMNIQGWLPWGLTGLISLLSKGLSRIFSSTTVWKHPFFGAKPYLCSYPDMITGKCTLAPKRTVTNNSHQIWVIFSFLSCIWQGIGCPRYFFIPSVTFGSHATVLLLLHLYEISLSPSHILLWDPASIIPLI